VKPIADNETPVERRMTGIAWTKKPNGRPCAKYNAPRRTSLPTVLRVSALSWVIARPFRDGRSKKGVSARTTLFERPRSARSGIDQTIELSRDVV
jgi:hypothetical protein